MSASSQIVSNPYGEEEEQEELPAWTPEESKQRLKRNSEAERQICSNCSGASFIEDTSHGDCVCTTCGVVAERLYDDAPIKRVFADDSAADKETKQQHSGFNAATENSLRSANGRLDQEEQFLYDGFASIDASMKRLFPDVQPASARTRAHQLYKVAFDMQVAQKKGRATHLKGRGMANWKRQKFARRKSFVIAAIAAGLRREGIGHIRLPDLNGTVEGKDVSLHSLQRCFRELEVHDVDPKSLLTDDD
jgi:transcription initiation factor TFIIIB Brf1 subunit/transcription initiation factor TFIIB